jgi:ppGpp synthetase/RelA/SpoT-type nucleotidyltranferase
LNECRSNEYEEFAVDLSKRRLDGVGGVLRVAAGELSLDEHPVAEALEIAERFRVAHAPTLGISALELDESTADMNAWRGVGWRLKRLDTIQGKLVREPSLKLSRMRDIAGCRLTVPSLEHLLEARDRVAVGISGEVVRVVDDVQQPRPSGYRGVHIIARYGELLTEFQIRTQLMHRWAQLSEGVQALHERDQPLPDNLEIARWLRDYAEALAHRDKGEMIPFELERRIRTLPMEVADALVSRGR